MNLVELLLLSLALGVDCFVVSFSQGLIFTKNKRLNALKLASVMGLFQGGMPIISYLATSLVSNYLEGIAKWIVFIIFVALGLNFIKEAFDSEKERNISCIGFRCLISFGIATSIDALGAGVNLKFTGSNLTQAVLIIGLGSFLLSVIGFLSGNKLKNIPSKFLEICGGIILIGLGIKALI